MVIYHKGHHTTSMKKHITFEHANVWERWKTTCNFQVVTKVGGQAKSKKCLLSNGVYLNLYILSCCLIK